MKNISSNKGFTIWTTVIIVVVIAVIIAIVYAITSKGSGMPAERTPNSTASSTAATTTDVVMAPATNGPISYALTADKSTYSQDEKIVMKLAVSNNTDKAQTFTFSNGCQGSYVIGDFDSSKHTVCTQAQTSFTISPFQGVQLALTHYPSVARLMPGSYTIKAGLIGYGTATAKVTITKSGTVASSEQPAVPGWKLYRNNLGFNLSYPSDWKLEVIGQSNVGFTQNEARNFDIVNTSRTQGLSFHIADLGSVELGTQYAGAKTLQEYLNMLPTTDPSNNPIRRFVQKMTLDGREVYWYQTFEWNKFTQVNGWVDELYWQRRSFIYRVDLVNPTTRLTTNDILATFTFTN